MLFVGPYLQSESADSWLCLDELFQNTEQLLFPPERLHKQ